MATKKLTVEVDADTAKAKKKLQEMENSGGQSVAPQVENAAEKMARSMDRASAATNRHAEAAEKSSVNMGQAAKAFAGMGVALATKYAESNMTAGSTEQKAVGYIGGAISGALTGSVAGPLGMIAGAVTAIAGKFMSDRAAEQQKVEANRQQNASNRETFTEWARARSETLKFRETLEALTNAETPLVERQKMLADKMKELDAREVRLRDGARWNSTRNADAADQKRFGENMRDLQSVTQQKDQLKSLAKSLEGEAKREPKKEPSASGRPDYSAVDSLARIGGNFAGASDTAMRDLAQNGRDQLAVLREIRDKKTGGTF